MRTTCVALSLRGGGIADAVSSGAGVSVDGAGAGDARDVPSAAVEPKGICGPSPCVRTIDVPPAFEVLPVDVRELDVRELWESMSPAQRGELMRIVLTEAALSALRVAEADGR